MYAQERIPRCEGVGEGFKVPSLGLAGCFPLEECFVGALGLLLGGTNCKIKKVSNFKTKQVCNWLT